jgi:hypothetical protein
MACIPLCVCVGVACASVWHVCVGVCRCGAGRYYADELEFVPRSEEPSEVPTGGVATGKPTSLVGSSYLDWIDEEVSTLARL